MEESPPSPLLDEQLILELISTLQFEAASRDGQMRFITESRMEEENILEAWISFVQSIGASINIPLRVVRGVDHPKLEGNLDHFI